jgi:predicted nucleic acid-binding protein
MSRVVFDTNIFIEYDIPDNLLKEMAVSTIVLFELSSTTNDKSARKAVERLWQQSKKKKRLITPDDDDWREAGKILSRLRFGEKSASKGKTPKLPNAERITRDALIARTVFKKKYLLVTQNTKDFKLISRFCSVNFVSGKDFFGY